MITWAAAEFEWGAVPAALAFIYDEARKGHVISGQHQGVYYICPKPYEAGVQKLIDALLADERSVRLMEYCGLKDAMNLSSDRHREDLVGWLELNNGFFFFTDSEMFEKTKQLFSVS